MVAVVLVYGASCDMMEVVSLTDGVEVVWAVDVGWFGLRVGGRLTRVWVGSPSEVARVRDELYAGLRAGRQVVCLNLGAIGRADPEP